MAAANRIADPFLAPRHVKLLRDRAIAADVSRERGTCTESIPPNLADLGFMPAQRGVGMVIPLHSIRGKIEGHFLRRDEPRINKKGKPVKYETPAGSHVMIDVPPRCRAALGDPKVGLVTTEGPLKADAGASAGLCCIGLMGVWSWRGTNQQGGKAALADWESIALNGRRVFIAFDSDLTTNRHVRAALQRLKAFLESRGAKVKIILLPEGAVDPETGKPKKVGLDDYLAAGHTVAELMALAVDTLPPLHDEAERRGGPYLATRSGLFFLKLEGDAEVEVPQANFWAEIVENVNRDNGAEIAREYAIEAHRGDETITVSTPAAKFQSLAWVAERLPPRFIICAGSTIRDRFREATQRLSDEDIPDATVFTAPGWRRFGDQDGYVHGGGVLGLDVGVRVELPDDLAPFVLPTAPTGEDLIDAVRSAWGLLHFGPTRLAGPLFCVSWRAVIKAANFSIWMHGPTGVFKTERAVLTMQHFGMGFTSDRPYASWHSDSANALREKLFLMKDAPALLDDYRPALGAAERAKQQQVVDQILRAAGNHAGRATMTSDLRLRSGRAPRCLPTITAEDLPAGESVKGRALLLDVRPGDFLKEQLSNHQKVAAQGRLAAAMAAFITWFAPKRESVLDRWETEYGELRSKATQGEQHSRTPGIVADLYLGAKLFFEFAVEKGAVSAYEAELSLITIWSGLIEASREQVSLQVSDKPEVRFIELLRSSTASGGSHFADRDGGHPIGKDEKPMDAHGEASAWGWRFDMQYGWRAMGARIGWVDLAKGEVYLDPSASYKAAASMVADGNGLAVGEATLAKRMNEAKLLLRTEQHQQKRPTLRCRETLEGARRDVLVVSITTLQPET